jgi:hypothetical protein
MRTIKNSWLKSLVTGIKEYSIGHDNDDIEKATAEAIAKIDAAYFEKRRFFNEMNDESFIDGVVERINRKQLK